MSIYRASLLVRVASPCPRTAGHARRRLGMANRPMRMVPLSPMTADAELLVAWRSGDGLAGSALMARHIPLLRRFFDRRVSTDAEDLMQQTFLACLRSKGNIRSSRSFRAYLLRIARSRLNDHIRVRGRRPLDDWTTSLPVIEHTSPSERVGKQETKAALLRGIRGLPPAQREVLELHYWEELHLEEVAQVVGVPVGTIKSRLRLARASLHRQLVEKPAPVSLPTRC